MTQHRSTSAPDEKQWEEAAKNMLKAEMTRQGVSYAMLVERLGEFGVTDNEPNLRNKVSRGRFTAVFLLQCLAALDAEWVKVPGVVDASDRVGQARRGITVNVDFAARRKASGEEADGEATRPLGKAG